MIFERWFEQITGEWLHHHLRDKASCGEDWEARLDQVTEGRVNRTMWVQILKSCSDPAQAILLLCNYAEHVDRCCNLYAEYQAMKNQIGDLAGNVECLALVADHARREPLTKRVRQFVEAVETAHGLGLALVDCRRDYVEEKREAYEAMEKSKRAIEIQLHGLFTHHIK